MRWLLVLLALPLASAQVVHEDPLDDQAAPHPALFKEFDIAQVHISHATQDEWGFDGVIIDVAYDCPPPHSAFVTNRTTHFTFTVGNETVRQGVWVATLDWCSSGHATGIVLGDVEGCLIRDIFVEAVWDRQDGVQVLDRAPDAGGLTFDACPASAQVETRPAPNTPHSEPSGNGTTEPADAQREVPAGLWLGLVALFVAARRP